MSINEPLFERVYTECKTIIETSNDKNIKLKLNKLKTSYNDVVKNNDCELQEFYSIIHEIYTYRYLCDLNLNPVAENDDKAGPDYKSDIGYIECVSVTKGQSNSPQRKFIEYQLSQDVNRYLAALPRITSVICDKKNKLSAYLDKGVVEKDTPLIIAVNTSIFSNEFHHDLIIELVLKILYGIDAQTFLFNRYTREFIQQKDFQTHVYDDKGKKDVDRELSLDYFALDDFKIISAIIVVNNAIGEKVEDKYFNLFLNPNATSPVDLGKIGNIRNFNILKAADDLLYKWYNWEHNSSN